MPGELFEIDGEAKKRVVRFFILFQCNDLRNVDRSVPVLLLRLRCGGVSLRSWPSVRHHVPRSSGRVAVIMA